MSYIPLLKMKVERAMRLHQYGFECECEACAAGMGDAIVGDSRGTEIRQLIESLESKLSAEVGSGVVARRKAQRLANGSLRLVGLFEAERSVDYYVQAYRTASLSYGRIELWEEGANWTLKSLEHREIVDEYSPEANKMRGWQLASSCAQGYMKPGSQ